MKTKYHVECKTRAGLPLCRYVGHWKDQRKTWLVTKSWDKVTCKLCLKRRARHDATQVKTSGQDKHPVSL